LTLFLVLCFPDPVMFVTRYRTGSWTLHVIGLGRAYG